MRLAPFLVRSNQCRLGKDVRVHLRFDRRLVRLIEPAQHSIVLERRAYESSDDGQRADKDRHRRDASNH